MEAGSRPPAPGARELDAQYMVYDFSSILIGSNARVRVDQNLPLVLLAQSNATVNGVDQRQWRIGDARLRRQRACGAERWRWGWGRGRRRCRDLRRRHGDRRQHGLDPWSTEATVP